jgi:hypothetical protein
VDGLGQIPGFQYSLPLDDSMFYGYTDKVTAMEKAKYGALKYINHMIREVEQGIKKLVQYRNDHYEDLNSTCWTPYSQKKRNVHQIN